MTLSLGGTGNPDNWIPCPVFITGVISCVFIPKKGRLGKLEGKFTKVGVIRGIFILSIYPIVFIVLPRGPERGKRVALPQNPPSM